MTYDSVGRCIYCHATVYSDGEPSHPLGDEHIIPRSIGGKLLLPEASCKNCERITSRLESKCVPLFDPGRLHLGLRGKKGKRRTMAPMQSAGGRTLKMPLEDHPGILTMFRFGMPAALLCVNPDDEITGNVVVAPAVSDLNQRIKRAPGGLQFRLGNGVSAETFARMLAKIAHAYATATLGIDGFTPFLPPTIIGEPPYRLARIVGSGVIEEQKSKERHEIQLTRMKDLRGADLIMVRIRLFGDRGCPSHYVVAGTPL
jgi:hypothetical protein